MMLSNKAGSTWSPSWATTAERMREVRSAGAGAGTAAEAVGLEA
jgi:hypothetical protein